jgi:hypothetical protein
MVALHPTTTADVDTGKHMDLHLCDSRRGSWMHIPFCLASPRPRSNACWNLDTKRKLLGLWPGRLRQFSYAHAHADNSSGNVIVGLAEASTRRQLAFE